MTCTCTSDGLCPTCRPNCQWIISFADPPVRCGDAYYTTLRQGMAVCVSHFEFYQLHRAEQLAAGLP